MPYAVTGSPVQPFVDAVLAVLRADTTLLQLLGVDATQATSRIASALKARSRTDRPYILVGQSEFHEDPAAMQQDGGHVSVGVDVYSDKNGPGETTAIQSRIRFLFPRDRVLVVGGWIVFGGSLAFDEEHVFEDSDPDMPERSGYRGAQRLSADVEAAAS